MTKTQPTHHVRPGRLLWSISAITILLVLSVVSISSGSDTDAPSQPGHAMLMQQCEAVLIDGLTSDEFWPSLHAAEALTAMGRQDLVIARMTALLPNTTDPQHRVGVARELVRAGEADKLELILDALRDPDSTARVHAAESLFKLGVTCDRTALRAAMKQETDPGLQAFAAAALAQADDADTDARAVLHDLLDHEQDRVRNYAIFCVGLLGDRSFIDPLRRIAERPDTEPAEATKCVQALALLGDEASQTELASHLTSEAASVRASAAMTAGLADITALRPLLFEGFDDPVSDVRIRSAHALILLDQMASVSHPGNESATNP